MNEIEEKIMIKLNNLLDNHIEVINVNVFGSRGQRTVQIMIESENGITIDACANTSRKAQNIIKLDNIIDDHYNIEVSSPGINRPLFNLKDFKKFKGEKVFIELKRNINNKKRFTGSYDVINEKIIFLDSSETTEISIDDNPISFDNKYYLLLFFTIKNYLFIYDWTCSILYFL